MSTISAARLGLRRMVTLVGAATLLSAFLLSPGIAHATLTGRVLIWGPSVTGGASSLEATRAASLGFTVEVVDNAGWTAKTAADFAGYRALIIGDPTCSPTSEDSFYSTINANKATWSSVVDGNIIVNGTDPAFHNSAHPGGGTLTERGIAFAGDVAGKTGLYASLSCAFWTSAGNNVDFLSPFGVFTASAAPDCYNNAHIVATHPALAGLTDAALSNWSCSVHEVFTAWPTSFTVLATARDFGTYAAADGSVGLPYIVARGEGLSASDISLSPASQSLDISGTAALTGLVNSGGSPSVGQTVTFTVLTGPNAGVSGTGVTDSTGVASFGYPGTAVGTDTVQASFVRGTITQSSNTATVTWTHVVVDTPPVISVDTTAPSGVEGSPIAINTTVTDDHGPLTYSWATGSLAALDVGAACSFSPANTEDTAITCTDDTNGGTVQAVLTVSDGVNPDVTQTVAVTITNAKPVITGVSVTGGSQVACLAGNTVLASFTATDAGLNDTRTGVINWGDGSTNSTGFSGSHSYGPGSFTISVSATDDDGATSDAVTGTSTAAVSLLFTTSGVQQPINQDGTSNFKKGSTIPVKIRATDCNGTAVDTVAPQIALTKVGLGGGDVNEVVSSSAADTGVTMRSAGSGQYIYNLSTKLSRFNAGQDLTAGRYRLTITSPTIAPIVVFFDLRA